jgi:hypothetical protein
MNQFNGHTAIGDAPIVQGDANTIRVMQHLLQLAQSGQIIGVAAIGLTPDGKVHHSLALPSDSTAVMIALGGLSAIDHNLNEQLKLMHQKQDVSRIIKPALHR